MNRNYYIATFNPRRSLDVQHSYNMLQTRRPGQPGGPGMMSRSMHLAHKPVR